jgi:hypothetical protein
VKCGHAVPALSGGEKVNTEQLVKSALADHINFQWSIDGKILPVNEGASESLWQEVTTHQDEIAEFLQERGEGPQTHVPG